MNRIFFFSISILIFLPGIVFMGKQVTKNLRDPFFLPIQKKDAKETMRVSVSGIVQVGDKMSALITIGGERKIVFEGDKIGEYVVCMIDLDAITVKKGKKELRIPDFKKTYLLP
jgi:hypothetical protein